MKSEHTPGPWKWLGEDYRGGWGWSILAGPNGEGLIVGQDTGGGPCREMRAFMPIDPALCITGMNAGGKRHVERVHVYGEANARLIVKAWLIPELVEACKKALTCASINSDVRALIVAALAKVEKL